MAGGMTLIPTLKQRLAKPSDVVDLGGIKELAGIKVEGNNVVIGGMTRHADVATSAEVQGRDPGAGLSGGPYRRSAGAQPRHDRRLDRQQRSGGRLSGGGGGAGRHGQHQHSARSRPTILQGHVRDGARARARSITAVSFPKAEKAAYMKFPNPASRYAMVGVFVAKTAGGVRVAVTGAGARRVPRQGDGGGAGQELLARTRSRTSRSRPTG